MTATPDETVPSALGPDAFNGLGAMVLWLDPPGQILGVNNALTERTGFEAAQLVGASYWSALLQPEDNGVAPGKSILCPDTRVEFDRLAPDSPTRRIDRLWQTSGGEPRRVATTEQGAFDRQGRLIQVVITAIDVSENLDLPSVLTEIAGRLSALGGEDDLPEVCAAAAETFRADFAAVVLQGSSDQVEILAWHASDGQPAPKALQLAGTPIALVMREERPQAFEDVARVFSDPAQDENGLRGWLGVPLKAKGLGKRGVLYVASCGSLAFSSSGPAVLSLFASFAEKLIEQNLLRSNLEKAKESLEHRISERTLQLQQEVAERRFTENELTQNRERLSDMVEAQSDWLWETNAEMAFTYFTDNITDILGIRPDEIRGRSRAEFIASADPERLARHLADLAEHKPFRDFEYEFKRPDGETRFIRISGKPVFDEEDRFAGYRGTGTNITDQVLAERQAARATRLLHDAISSLNEGFMLLDRDWKLVLTNDRFRELYPITAKVLTPGVSLEDITRYSGRHGQINMMEKNLDEWVAHRLESYRHPGKAYLQQLETGQWIRCSDFRTSDGGLATVRTDVTELVRAQEKLAEAKYEAERANRAKSNFLAGMSHELRTPLNAIIGFSHTMTEQVFGRMPENYRDYADDIHRSGLHLLSLINDVLDLAKVEAGAMRLEPTNVDPAQMVEEAIRLVQKRAESGGVTLSTELPPGLPILWSDPLRLSQVLMNVISNGVKFTAEGGTVAISAGYDKDGLVLKIKDTGVGMTEDDIEQAISEFGQVDSHLTRPGEGTGLGLPLTMALVELLQGRLEIESEKGVGTTIHLWFPFRL
ncbi:MAG: ATP-binding protein [Magnetovibrionaceae bacterium]